MADWVELSDGSQSAARLLLEHRLYRSAASRAYYAAYAAVTARLMRAKSVTFVQGRDNPSHAELIRLIEPGLRQMGVSDPAVRDLTASMRYLRRHRVEADYMPGATVDRTEARNAVRYAAEIRRVLEACA